MVRQDLTNNLVVITARDGDGITRHLASHTLGARGDIIIDEAHFSPHTPSGPQQRAIVPKSAVEKGFLATGAGAHTFHRAAAAEGVPQLKACLAVLTALSATWPAQQVIDALATAAAVGRFSSRRCESIMQRGPVTVAPSQTNREDQSLAQGTAGWHQLGKVA